jgi:hypothetical protein
MQAVVKCKVSKYNNHPSDHLPIETILDLQPPPVERIELPFNYDKADWKTMEAKLPKYMPQVLDPNTATPDGVDKATMELSNALQQVIMETTPRKKACPFSKRWLNEDLTKQEQTKPGTGTAGLGMMRIFSYGRKRRNYSKTASSWLSRKYGGNMWEMLMRNRYDKSRNT